MGGVSRRKNAAEGGQRGQGQGATTRCHRESLGAEAEDTGARRDDELCDGHCHSAARLQSKRTCAASVHGLPVRNCGPMRCQCATAARAAGVKGEDSSETARPAAGSGGGGGGAAKGKDAKGAKGKDAAKKKK